MSPLFDDLHQPRMDPNAAEIFARTRTSDPETSQAAARTIDLNRLREIRSNVFLLFKVLGPMTQHMLIRQYHARHGADTPESSIRTRCAELVEAGAVVNTNERERLPSRRWAIVWAAKEGGER